MAKTILLADDSVTIQKVVELTFMEEDYEVIAVNDGNAALAKLSEISPDLVISDVHMPGASGYEVCRKVKAAIPGIPVVLLVGTFEPFDNDKAEVVGADTHLKKPFDSQDLLRVVRELTADAGAAPAVAEAAPEAAPFAAIASSKPPEVKPLQTAPASTEVRPPESDAFEALEELDVEPTAPMEAFAPQIESMAPEEQLLALDETGPMTAPIFADGAPAASASASEPEAAPAPAAGAASVEDSRNGNVRLSDEDVDRIAKRVIELAGESVLRDVAWEVVPDLAEVVIRDRIRELESQVE